MHQADMNLDSQMTKIHYGSFKTIPRKELEKLYTLRHHQPFSSLPVANCLTKHFGTMVTSLELMWRTRRKTADPSIPATSLVFWWCHGTCSPCHMQPVEALQHPHLPLRNHRRQWYPYLKWNRKRKTRGVEGLKVGSKFCHFKLQVGGNFAWEKFIPPNSASSFGGTAWPVPLGKRINYI